jgi:alanine racemase
VTFGARAQIRPGAIKHNFQIIKSNAPGCLTMAVIKGNAYGHGMLVAARALSDADAFGVARLTEAKSLREAGIEKPIVLLGGLLSRADLDVAIELTTSVCVHNQDQIDWLESLSNDSIDVWLKVDTGMNRLGFHIEEVEDIVTRLQACNAVSDLKLMTHFANADDVDDATTKQQIERFMHISAGFRGDVSIANSAGLFGWSGALRAFDELSAAGHLWIRPGIALFGISPIRGKRAADLGLKAAMHFESRLAAVKPLRAGEPVGYGGTWQSDRDTVLGIVAVGYGDGYTRYIPSGTPVLINGRRVPVVGVISMDLTAVDLGPAAVDKAGDTVILWGEGLPVEEVAEYAGTIPYQLVTGVTHREDPVFD